MGRLSNETINKVISLRAQEHDLEYIKDLTGVSVKTIKKIIQEDEAPEEENQDPEETLEDILGADSEEDQEEETIESLKEKLEVVKAWKKFWKKRYLKTHGKLIEYKFSQK